jgi:hypothetical protein
VVLLWQRMDQKIQSGRQFFHVTLLQDYPGYVRTRNQSDIDFFYYRRNLVTLAVSGRF